MKRREIKTKCGSTIVVDEDTELLDIKRAEPKFFQTSFGKRETFEVHRGFLIVRHTVQFTGRPPERRTVVYAFVVAAPGWPDQKSYTLCVSSDERIGSAAHARRWIDLTLDASSEV